MGRIGRPCTVCAHPQVDDINAAIVTRARGGFRTLSRQFGVTRDSLRRHAHNHLRDTIALADEVHAMLSAESLATELNKWNDETWALLERAKAVNNLTIQLGAIRAGREHIETFSRVSALGELARRVEAGEMMLASASQNGAHPREEGE